MKKYCIIPAIILICNNLSFSQIFEVDTIIFKTKNSVVSATLYDNHFYYLDKQGNIFKINSADNHEEIPNSNLNLESISNTDGKLIAKKIVPNVPYGTFYTYYYNGNEFKKRGKEKISDHNNKLYEDNAFIVTSSCNGEWGGSVFFEDKLTKKKYKCSATCPILVNKFKDSYIITATLSHMMGFTQIIQIKDPKQLQLLKKRPAKKNAGTYESRSTKGASILVDSIGVLALTSFIYQDESYHLISKGYDLGGGMPATYLSKIENGKFKSVKKLRNSMLWLNEEILYGDGVLLSVEDDETREVLLIGFDKNKITVFRFEQDT